VILVIKRGVVESGAFFSSKARIINEEVILISSPLESSCILNIL
jgi:hypothetical protein